MKLLLLCLCVAVANAGLAPVMQSAGRTVPDSWIIKVKDASLIDQVAEEIAGKFATKRLAVPKMAKIRTLIPAVTVKVPARLIDEIRSIEGIEFVKQDAIGTIYGTQYNPTWGLDRIDSRSGRDNRFNYNDNVQGEGVNIFIVDTGIRTTHYVFGGRASLLYGATDDHAHGTHCGGTSGGNTYGIARKANVYSVKVCDRWGQCPESTVVNGLQAILDATNDGVVSMSLGWPNNAFINSLATQMVGFGYTLSVAAGNENADACFVSPAMVPEVITVGATDSNDRRASFSNWGSCLDLFAPGDDIVSASHTSNYGTRTMSGTSMACPHVTGAAALYLGQNKGASPKQVHDAIVSGATSGAVSDTNGSPNKFLYVNY